MDIIEKYIFEEIEKIYKEDIELEDCNMND